MLETNTVSRSSNEGEKVHKEVPFRQKMENLFLLNGMGRMLLTLPVLKS